MNWFMTCWSTKECPEAVVGVITVSGYNMVSVDCMLISIVSASVKALEMLCAVAAEALAPRAWDLKPDDLLSPLCLMCDLRNSNLSCFQL